MRLRHLLIVTCCVVVQLAAPAPAQAWWDWLDQLSGPGPFWGVDLSYRLICIADTEASHANVSTDNIANPALRGLARFGGVGCVTDPSKNPLSSFNVTVGFFWTHKNDLQTSDNLKLVTMWRFEPSYSTFLDPHKTFELVTGMGWLSIDGPAFERFNRFYWKPVQLNITPGGSSGKKLPIVGIGVMIIRNGFDARDFGSTSAFHTDTDVLTTLSFTYDFGRRGS